jgi:hypothetical protein
MEEKKKNVAQPQEKLSYDALKQTASDLYQQNMNLRRQLDDFNASSFLLSMLFKVMDHSSEYDAEFVKWAKENIQGALTAFVESFQEPESKKNEDK